MEEPRNNGSFHFEFSTLTPQKEFLTPSMQQPWWSSIRWQSLPLLPPPDSPTSPIHMMEPPRALLFAAVAALTLCLLFAFLAVYASLPQDPVMPAAIVGVVCAGNGIPRRRRAGGAARGGWRAP